MRIAMIYFGGPRHYSHLLIKAVLDRGNAGIVCAPVTDKQNLISVVGNEDNFCFYGRPRIRYPSNLMTMAYIAQSVLAFKPDVVHILDYYPWMRFFLKRLSKIPLVMTVHDPIRHIGDMVSIRVLGSERWFYKYISQFIVLGNGMKRLFSERYGIDEIKVNVIPHGDSCFYSKGGKPDIQENGNCVLFFGRIYRYKGLEYLAQAEPLISRIIPDVRFVIAGTGSEVYLKKVKKHIINEHRFMFRNGYIQDDMMAQLFQEASLVVLPYIDGTQSGVISMAYAFRKPVVVTDVGSLSEYVDEGETGFIVPPRDVKRMADRIIELLMDRDLREKMGENGYHKSVETFSWDKIGEQTIKVYRKACDTAMSYG